MHANKLVVSTMHSSWCCHVLSNIWGTYRTCCFTHDTRKERECSKMCL